MRNRAFGSQQCFSPTRARGGKEFFEKDGNYIYEMAQWYPRLAAFTDVNGWQHKQFLGRGEFALEFGDYKVSITAPADHVVASTGTLRNAAKVLTDEQRAQLDTMALERQKRREEKRQERAGATP